MPDRTKPPGLSSPSDKKSQQNVKLAEKTLRELITKSGRLPYEELIKLINEHDRDTFVSVMGYPALVGQGVREGTIEPKAPYQHFTKRRATMAFKPSDLRSTLLSSDSLLNLVYPLIKWASGAAHDAFEFSIGSGAANDIVLPDFAISESHARITYGSKKVYLLRDEGSTNGTSLNGVRLGEEHQELHSGDRVTLGRYAFGFLSPDALFSLITDRQAKKK